jgi:hypothetical protein
LVSLAFALEETLSAEALIRAVLEAIGGLPDHWQRAAPLIRQGLEAAQPHLPVTTAELLEMLSGDFGPGPSDSDPGF